MKPVSKMISLFFEDFEQASNSLDIEALRSLYGDVFMFAGPAGSQSVRKDDFLRVLPMRHEFFKTIGLVSSKVTALEETKLEENYYMVKSNWEMRFEKSGSQPILESISATYILFQRSGSLQIVFQLDHQDLTERVKTLGLYPSGGMA